MDNLLHLHYLLTLVRLKPERVLEVGCGTASHSVFLSFFLPKTRFWCLDDNRKVLSVAKRNAQSYRRRNMKFVHHNAFHLTKVFTEKEFDITISQGLLEHFSNEEIQALIDEQLYVSDRIVANVPSENFPGKGLLRERRLSKTDWVDILSNTSCRHYRIRDMIDLGLRTRLNALKISLRQAFKPMHYLIEII